jgi:hypothetical protein
MYYNVVTGTCGPRMAGGPQPVVTTDRDYETALTRANDVLAAWQAFKAHGKSEEQKQILNGKICELIKYLLEQYSGLEVDLGCDDMMKQGIHAVFSEGPDRLTLDRLHVTPEPLVPVVVMREILNTHRVIFSPKAVYNWKDFVGLYGKYILAA